MADSIVRVRVTDHALRRIKERLLPLFTGDVVTWLEQEVARGIAEDAFTARAPKWVRPTVHDNPKARFLICRIETARVVLVCGVTGGRVTVFTVIPDRAPTTDQGPRRRQDYAGRFHPWGVAHG